MSELVLHVGMARSAAVLQPALARLRPQLRRHGIAYLAPPAKHPAAAARDLAMLSERERSRATGSGPVLLSDDRLLGPGAIGLRDRDVFRPDAAAATGQVIDALQARSVRIVIHPERQDRLMELAQLGRIRAGRTESLADMYPRRFEPVLDYGPLIARLRDVPRVDEVVVRPAELADAGTHAFVADFLSLLGLHVATFDLDVLGGDIPAYPSTYSDRGAAVAITLNPMLSGDEVAHLREFLVGHHSTGDVPMTQLFDRDERERVLQTYADANRALFAEHLPALPVDSYRTDPATFGLGNVLVQPPIGTGRQGPESRSVAAVLAGAATVPRRARLLARTLARGARRSWASARGRRPADS